MSRSGDYLTDMTRLLSPTDVAELHDVLTELHAIVDLPAPRPSAELAELLECGLPTTSLTLIAGDETLRSRPRRAVRHTVMVALLSSVASVPVMGVAAAQDRLPDVAQRVVARVIEVTTPFTVADPGSAPQKSQPSLESVNSPGVEAPTDPATEPGNDDELAPGDKADLFRDEMLGDEPTADPGLEPADPDPITGETPSPSAEPSALATGEPSPTPTATPSAPPSGIEGVPSSSPTTGPLVPPPAGPVGGRNSVPDDSPSPSPEPTPTTTPTPKASPQTTVACGSQRSAACRTYAEPAPGSTSS